MNFKEEITNELEKIDREGMDSLLEFLESELFYTKPASIKYHHSEEGGLARHSIEVFKILKDLKSKYDLDLPENSLKIEGLLHDVCKVQKYEKNKATITEGQNSYLKTLIKKSGILNDYNLDLEINSEGTIITSKEHASKLIDYLKNDKKGAPPERKQMWDYSDDKDLPLGHGEESIILLQDFIKLKDREKLAIRWHMGAFEKGALDQKNSDFNQAVEKFPDVKLLQIADYQSTFEDSFIWEE